MNTSIAVSWRPIVGFPGYEVSNEGEVRSFRKRGHGAQLGPKNVPTRVTPFLHDMRGSMRWAVKLSLPGGKRALRTIAPLVLETFVGYAPDDVTKTCGKPDVDFLDGNPLNCHVKNLRWRTTT